MNKNDARTAACVLLASALLAACTNAADSPPSASSTSSTVPPTSAPSTSISPTPSSSAESAALASYRRYWAAQVASQADPTKPQDPDLARYAAGDALAGAQSTLLLFRQNGVAMRGKPVLAPVIGSPSGATLVTIDDCVDSSNWKPIYVATGKSALAPGQAERVPVVSAVKLVGGKWVVATSVTHRDRTC